MAVGVVLILAVTGVIWLRHFEGADKGGMHDASLSHSEPVQGTQQETLPARKGTRRFSLPAGDKELPPGVMLPAKRKDPNPEDFDRMEPLDFKALTADQLLALHLNPESPPRCFGDRKNFLRVLLAEAWLTKGETEEALSALDGADAQPDAYQLMADDLQEEIRATVQLGDEAVKNLSRRKENDRIFELSQRQLEDEGGNSDQRIATLSYWTGQALSQENRELGLIELGRAWHAQGQPERALSALREATGVFADRGPNREVAEKLIQQIQAEMKDEEK